MKRGRHFWGRVLVLIGVAAWVPYAIQAYGLGHEVAMQPYLAAHLVGVIPGSLLLHGDKLLRLIGSDES
ncbi:MAG: hypothetical protein ABEK03_07275 [Candidatus Bipolaricaulia bacterium]